MTLLQSDPCSVRKHHLVCDLAVIGGGMSGLCAALAAARLGAKVVLVQDRPVLGGNASSEIRMHITGADCHGQRPGAREGGIIEELRLDNAVYNSNRSYSQWDLLLYDKVVSESNITLLLNATCIGCEIVDGSEERMIRTATVSRPSTEELFEIEARFFADCSGDGVLGVAAGADYRMGREGKDEFCEAMAQEKPDQFSLGSSILFTARKYEMPQPYIAPAWVRTFNGNEFKGRDINSYEYGYWWVEWGGHLKTITDGDNIRHELLRITLGVWNYIKNSGKYPDSANWSLDWVGSVPAKRESRRFLGPHVLTENDIESSQIFADQVLYGGWWIDLHPVKGVDDIDKPGCEQHHIPLYSIPLRSLYSRNVSNLFFAGRNISATHVAFASTRIMATCAVMGQTIGTVAALMRTKSGGIEESATPEAIGEIQQILLREDAYLPGLRDTDPLNLARESKVAASSEGPEAPARKVINGIARSVDASWGPWAEADGNCWESTELPAWIELTWPQPQELGEVHLTFCTGMQRELTLTPCDYLANKMVRGPQPETVKDYNLWVDGKKVLEVRGNYQRKCKHLLPKGTEGTRLRLEILATNGLPIARVFEVRAYARPTL